jgi:carbamoyl-phosphate synthase large subunit
MMRILVTAIGSMSAQAVIRSLKNSFDCIIVGCDIHESEWLPMAAEVDYFYKICRADGAMYVEQLLSICEKKEINYLIPLIDPEIDVISENRLLFEEKQIILCMPNSESIRICRDKYLLYNFFKNDDTISVIPSFRPTEAERELKDRPFIAKPRIGRSSRGLQTFLKQQECKFTSNQYKRYIFQPFIEGEIYTVDLLRTGKRELIALGRKELIRTPHGAGISVEISDFSKLLEVVKIISEKINLNGVSNFEFISQGDEYYLMDINPRFSAGVGFSILAGFDIVKLMLDNYKGGKTLKPAKFKYGIYTRTCMEILLN